MGKGLEVIFVSSDRDEQAFGEYFGEMPWVALPYSNRDLKDQLSKKFKVQGIPSLVILDEQGMVITKDGRQAVSSDPTGEEFPWRPKSLHEILSGSKLIGKDGPVASSALEGKVLGLYFSAHWCPPCRGFTPKLAEWYTKNLQAKGMEIIFISSDKDEGAFKEYYKEQPWLALDYSQRKEKEQLSTLFEVEGIPSLVIVGTDGATITKKGRAAISADPEGASFPWYPKPVSNLKDGPDPLNESPVVLALCEGADAATKQSVEDVLTPFAKKYLDSAKAKGEDPSMTFMIATESDGLSEQLRTMMELPKVTETPRLMLIDVPAGMAFYEGPTGPITSTTVEQFLAAFDSATLEQKKLKQ